MSIGEWKLRRRRALQLGGAFALVSCSDNEPDDNDPPSNTAWSRWRKSPGAVLEGNFTAADPSIVWESDQYLAIFTDLDVSVLRTVLASATSRDGTKWDMSDNGDPFRGLALRGREGHWDENIESGELVHSGHDYLLYYSGYREVGHPMKGFPASIGLAISADGRRFSRFSDMPIIVPTEGWYDNDATYSPTVIHDGNMYVMLYAGHSYTRYDKIGQPGVYLLAATSPDGRGWTKRPTPVVAPGRNDIRWMRDGAAEPCLVRGPDDRFYLFFTGLAGEERRIGVAVAASPFGPWEFNSEPIVTASGHGFDTKGAFAPSVLIKGGKARLWFHSADAARRIRIGYAEADWPIYNPTPAGARPNAELDIGTRSSPH